MLLDDVAHIVCPMLSEVRNCEACPDAVGNFVRALCLPGGEASSALSLCRDRLAVHWELTSLLDPFCCMASSGTSSSGNPGNAPSDFEVNSTVECGESRPELPWRIGGVALDPVAHSCSTCPGMSRLTDSNEAALFAIVAPSSSTSLSPPTEPCGNIVFITGSAEVLLLNGDLINRRTACIGAGCRWSSDAANALRPSCAERCNRAINEDNVVDDDCRGTSGNELRVLDSPLLDIGASSASG
mmetsp:Transcript_65108/g.187341  ORF Transcript_65108/g.187341 Transcript_65108/m.187341 type:complete len:242 (+) Transcript_65108:1650-2375(+)